MEFARFRLVCESYSGADVSFVSEQQLSITIHGKSASIDPKRPYADISSELPYLWQMTLGYLGCALGFCQQNPERAPKAFTDIAIGFSSIESWAENSAHDRHWHPYSASHRLINIIAAMQIINQDDISPRDLKKLEASVKFHTMLISISTEYDIHYNHLAKNLLALIVSQSFRTGRVSRSLFARYRRAVEFQVLADGGHAELCPMYHAQFLTDLILLRKLPDHSFPEGMLEWLEALILKMQNALSVMTHPDGDISLFGDSWLYEAPASEFLVGSKCHSIGVQTLPDTGYTKIVAGEYVVIMDHGVIGPSDNPGHAHDDCLSIEVSVMGSRLIRDYGVEAYTEGNGRKRTRSVASHNCPTFPGDRGMDAWGAFRVGSRVAQGNWSTGKFNGWHWIKAEKRSLGWSSPTASRTVFVHAEFGVFVFDRWLVDKGCTSFLVDPTVESERAVLEVLEGDHSFSEGHKSFNEFGNGVNAIKLFVESVNRRSCLFVGTPECAHRGNPADFLSELEASVRQTTEDFELPPGIRTLT